MKKEIDIDEIKAGDLIRCEGSDGVDSAREYRAVNDEDSISVFGRYYLLERPFKPVWGTVVGLVDSPSARAVYLPGVVGDELPWLTKHGWVAQSNILEYMGLIHPWVVIEGPTGGRDYV